MQRGYIKLFRCMLDKPWSKHPDYVALWVYCLMRGNYAETDIITRTGSFVHLMPGQFVTSREQISINTGIEESKVERILKVFKSEQQIEQQNCGKFRIISVLNWDKFQQNEQQIEQQVNNRCTTDEQQVNTDKKVKERKEVKKPSAKKPSGDHQFFIAWWKMAFEKITGNIPTINGRTGKQVREMLSGATLKHLVCYASIVLTSEDDFYREKGRTLAILQSQLDGFKSRKNSFDFASWRELGIMPPDGVKLEEWNFWEVASES
jgi:hypothetical protein